MVIEKLLIDRLTAPKTFLNAVPKVNAGLAELPAQVDFLPVEERGEVDQTDVEIFHQTSVFVNFFDDLLKLLGS